MNNFPKTILELHTQLHQLKIERDAMEKRIYYGYFGLWLAIFLISDLVFHNGLISEIQDMLGKLGVIVCFLWSGWSPIFFYKKSINNKKYYGTYYALQSNGYDIDDPVGKDLIVTKCNPKNLTRNLTKPDI